jgi:hypothetical protein
MSSVTEALAMAAREAITIACPYTDHSSVCACRGTRKVKACEDCGGAGWDGKRNRPCQGCAAKGCVAVAK